MSCPGNLQKQHRRSAIRPLVCGADFKTIQEASQGVAQTVKCLLHKGPKDRSPASISGKESDAGDPDTGEAKEDLAGLLTSWSSQALNCGFSKRSCLKK